MVGIRASATARSTYTAGLGLMEGRGGPLPPLCSCPVSSLPYTSSPFYDMMGTPTTPVAAACVAHSVSSSPPPAAHTPQGTHHYHTPPHPAGHLSDTSDTGSNPWSNMLQPGSHWSTQSNTPAPTCLHVPCSCCKDLALPQAEGHQKQQQCHQRFSLLRLLPLPLLLRCLVLFCCG